MSYFHYSEFSYDLLSSVKDQINSFHDKKEPHVGACNDEADCSKNGECIDNYCVCNPGFDYKDHPKDCSSKLEWNTSFICLILAQVVFIKVLISVFNFSRPS